MSTDLRIGSHIGGYAVESLLGRGGMSAVYLAEDPKLGRKVALKVMSEELAENDAFRTRFVREAQMAANLEHPSIVPVYDAGDSDGVLYLAMRVIRGTDLRRVITEGGPMDPERAITLLRQVASALDAAHRAGLVHRDVKPANVLLSREGDDEHAYLTDFGLTKHVSSRSGLTKTGTFMGTIDYVAPEQIRGNEVDGTTDLYSLGCVLYECLTSEVPFPKDQDVAILFAHLEDDRPKVTDHRADLPPEIDEVVAKAMARSPEDRFDTCLGFIAAAREALGVTSSSGPAVAVVPSATVFAVPPVPAEPKLEPHPSFPPRGPAVPAADASATPTDTSVPPADTSVPPSDVSTPPADTSVPPDVLSVPSAEVSIPPLEVQPAAVVAAASTSGSTDQMEAPSAPAAVPPPPVVPATGPQRGGGSAGPKRGLVIVGIVVLLAIVGGVAALALGGGGGGEKVVAQPSVSATQAPSPAETPSPTVSPTQSPSGAVDALPVRPPINVHGTDITSSSITLTWSAAPNGGEAVRFRVLRDGELVVQSSKTTFVDDNLAASTTFVYQVVAVGADDSKAASKEVSLTTLAAATSGGSTSGGSTGGTTECTLLDKLAGKC